MRQAVGVCSAATAGTSAHYSFTTSILLRSVWVYRERA